jgi:hypothetical protein
MAITEARRLRLEQIEALVSQEPTITQADIVRRLGLSSNVVSVDVKTLGLKLRDARSNESQLYLHGGLWCIRCECGEYVPVCEEEGEDVCPQCGRGWAIRVVRR